MVPVTVPNFLAYCGVSAALRRFRRTKSPFLAILVLKEPDAADAFQSGAEYFLRQFRKDHRDDYSVIQVSNHSAKNSTPDIIRIRRAVTTGSTVVVWSTSSAIDSELQLFADAVIEPPSPSLRQMRAAFKRNGVSISSDDAAMLLSQTWSRLEFAFPPDRPVISGLQRLRTCSPEVVDQNSEHVDVTPGVGLFELHGFGEAAAWGGELAQDLASYKAGKIPWADVDAGAVISGPPGTGKTRFAEVLARACAVPIVAASAASWQAEGHLNDFLAAMKAAFDKASSKAPSLLFIDEIDTFSDRGNYKGQSLDYHRQTVNALLELLDGFQRRTGVVVIAATNYPEHLDAALRRPGRLGRHLEIQLPDDLTREKIFEGIAGFPVPKCQADFFRRGTEGMSGADIEQIIRDARRLARRRGEGVNFSDVLATIRPLIVIPPEHVKIAAFHEAGHAIVGLVLGMKLEGISLNSMVRATGHDTLGSTSFAVSEFPNRTKSYYLNQIAMLLGGLAAEVLAFGEFSRGAADGNQSDLARATTLATKIEACWGFGESLIVEAASDHDLKILRNRDAVLRASIDKTLDRQFKRACSILADKRSALDQAAHQLADTRYLTDQALEDIILQNCTEFADVTRCFGVTDAVSDVFRGWDAAVPTGLSDETESSDGASFGSALDEIGWKPRLGAPDSPKLSRRAINVKPGK